jgi:hypothetical protein
VSHDREGAQVGRWPATIPSDALSRLAAASRRHSHAPSASRKTLRRCARRRTSRPTCSRRCARRKRPSARGEEQSLLSFIAR